MTSDVQPLDSHGAQARLDAVTAAKLLAACAGPFVQRFAVCWCGHHDDAR
jgi:hypothetical protein